MKTLSNMYLSVENLILRPYSNSDLQSLYEIASIPYVADRSGWPHHRDINDTIQVSNRFLEEKTCFSIVLSNKMIGFIHLETVDEDLAIHIKDFVSYDNPLFLSYTLHPNYWNKGITTKVVNAVINYLSTTKYDLLVSGHYVDNLPSGAVLLKNGFEPIFEIEGTTWDQSIKDILIYIKEL